MKINIGLSTLDIDDEIIKNDDVLSIGVILKNGPCNDNMCQLIRVPYAEINKDYTMKNSIKLFNPRIEIDTNVYDMISRERENIKIRMSNRKILIKGIHL
ncbi:hypothetical protein [Picrophilus oshimae]|uniref:Uncharacterized protein n=1 Tax=Picrophilus torridus (strain ATCC 700027 / DSM 9790 / JCM 10055 / NBRC 100828 / KAW 2/3) TaxID=1122961 RepID=A0A8G2FXH8_PICTO|nr:hypothetical protein [Picrophilus oshimae]SMD31339.1 hypothetical protein SAMN02745355_1267 [Picrophilus oshimae DSM 9789]